MSERWSDTFLDRMRERGDEPADQAISALFGAHEARAAQPLLDLLVSNDQPPAGSLPPELARFLERTAPQAAPPERVEQGQRVFAEFGPELLMILGCYSLPAAYAARKGVQVLYRTGYLLERPNRRLIETAQLLVDALSPGGLDAKGHGVRSAQKVRLMHAAIRHLLLRDEREPWNRALGVPINQEDLAGTLMTFAWMPLDGLGKLGIRVEPDAQESYLAAWREIGRIIGVLPELLPANMAEAFELTKTIHDRQIDPCAEGREMTRVLLDAMRGRVPAVLRQLPDGMLRLFLPREVADGLGVARHRIPDLVARIVAAATHVFADLEQEAPRHARVFRSFSLHAVQWMIDAERGGQRTEFRIPRDVRDAWGQPHSFERQPRVS